MSNSVNQTISDLCRATRMLSLVGASLKLRSDTAVDPAIRGLIDAGVKLAVGRDLPALSDGEAASMLVEAEMALAEAGELFRNPDRAAAWRVDDVQFLQAMTRASSGAFARIVALAATRPRLREALEGVFLDVGTGGGGIALRAVETCPHLEVDAIDLWAPALALAARNFAASPHAARIRLADLDVTALEAGPRYTLVWLPTMYMSRAVLERAVDRIVAASRSGAFLIAPVYTKPEDPFSAIMSALRTLRSGGDVTEPSEIGALLESRGFTDIEFDVAPVATFVLGRLP